MRKIKLLILFLLFTINSFAQVHKANCKIDFKLNFHTCSLLNKGSKIKSLEEIWDTTILKLEQQLSVINRQKTKFSIIKDTLLVAKKINVKNKTHLNLYKFPLKKLVDVTTSFKELIIYTKEKEIVVERYKYKKLNTSQITILKSIKKGEHTKLIFLFKQLKTINTYRDKL